nr:immunoglobulin heavy chain junction region [Mus musculus]MBK4185762.1 immunoglobulin heavy chain junction region [Mus musculus]MBK4185763.1 immunoglobulin heavy chain junction region [Mus musculus]MBK4185764.1 immunoglobulin heavy chain junction region [Mus musculus]MBK4185765.1 immunoglobulin heavy chain junction region [Mus musculus]
CATYYSNYWYFDVW